MTELLASYSERIRKGASKASSRRAFSTRDSDAKQMRWLPFLSQQDKPLPSISNVPVPPVCPLFFRLIPKPRNEHTSHLVLEKPSRNPFVFAKGDSPSSLIFLDSSSCATFLPSIHSSQPRSTQQHHRRRTFPRRSFERLSDQESCASCCRR